MSRPVANLQGALVLALSGVFLAAESVLVRLAGASATQGQIIFFRGAAQLILVLAFVMLWRRWADLRMTRPGLQVVRGLMSFITWWMFFAALLALDLALATVLTFTSQLFVVALAGTVLGEKVSAARWLATLTGFAGVVAVSGVGTARFDPMVFMGLGSAMCGAVIVFLNRGLTRTETTTSISLMIGLVATVGAIPFVLTDWRPLDAATVVLLSLAASAGAIGNILVTAAYSRGEVSALAPVPYLKLVWALAAGYLVFTEIPTIWTVLGAALIVASGLALTWVEHRRAVARAAHDATASP